jgi:signal peptide peptidase SppA
VIPIHGPISRRQDFFSLLFGIQSATTSGIANALRAAVADPGVGQIVLHVDSPGGETDGITELAAEIYEARARKPITAFIDTTAGSAAYWLASQADQIIVTPSGQVGSIGVFALHLDRSGELEQAGIAPTFIQAGKYKTEESPLHPLTDEARVSVQARVDAFYSMFTKDVARGRGVPVDTVRSQFGEGRMVLAKDAVTRGMADVVSDRITARRNPTKASAEEGLVFAAAHAAVALSEIGMGGH